jgi:uncharacterized protein
MASRSTASPSRSKISATTAGDATCGRRGDLKVETPFGRPQLGAKVELARHALSLKPETLDPVRLPVHDRYDFTLQPTPVVRIEEAVSEKLARYRRVSLARDLYDLQWFATSGTLDEALIRRLWVLKVYRDIVVDGRGTKPVDSAEMLRPRNATEFRHEDIGYLTKPVRLRRPTRRRRAALDRVQRARSLRGPHGTGIDDRRGVLSR